MGYCPGNIIQIMNGDNIKHVITFSQIVSGIKVVYPITDIELIATYYILNKDKKYTASKIGNTNVNCISDESNQSVRVIFEGYDLDDGNIICELKVKSKDSDYTDQTNDITVIIDTGIELISSVNYCQSDYSFRQLNIKNTIKTDIVVRRIEGNPSEYNSKYNYVYVL